MYNKKNILTANSFRAIKHSFYRKQQHIRSKAKRPRHNVPIAKQSRICSRCFFPPFFFDLVISLCRKLQGGGPPIPYFRSRCDALRRWNFASMCSRINHCAKIKKAIISERTDRSVLTRKFVCDFLFFILFSFFSFHKE